MMWILIMERVLYFATDFKHQLREVIRAWESRPERRSWEAHQIREAMLSRVKVKAQQFLPMIKTFVALCPLLGLLGTVTGMIQVFDVMAVAGSSNARSMAAGVSMATVPTMAGMVAALSGVFASTWLNKKSARELEILRESLTTDH
jgi:biopolymer transport protein ExbB